MPKPLLTGYDIFDLNNNGVAEFPVSGRSPGGTT
jgi:hypothetical protein